MIKHFFQWWFQQLKDLLPAGLKSRMRQELCLLYLDMSRDTVSIRANFRGHSDAFGELPLNEDADENPELLQWLRELPRQPDRIVLRIAQGRFITRELDLPLAAEQNLSESIGFQIEQLTPFNADQVLCFSGLLERLPSEKKLRAWMAVTPTQQIDNALQLLGSPPPTPLNMPRQQPASGGPLEIVFRPFGQSDSRGFRGTLISAILLIAALLGVGWLHVENRQTSHQHLQSALSNARSEANEAAALREAASRLQQQTEQLAGSLQTTPVFTALWADISERLDDQTSLQRIDLRDNKLVLQGLSENAPQLIEQLEASPWLDNVSFASSVTRDRASNKDRFNISAQLNPRGGAS